MCNYILDEGHSRGCPTGDECTKYAKGNPDAAKRHEEANRYSGWSGLNDANKR